MRSAIHTLMMDCRGTPRRFASLSKKRIIHIGKSTFTLLCSCPGLLAFDISRYLEISLPSSNLLSNSLAFININLAIRITAWHSAVSRYGLLPHLIRRLPTVRVEGRLRTCHLLVQASISATWECAHVCRSTGRPISPTRRVSGFW